MTITISSNEPSTIDRILQLLRREKVPFVYEPDPLDADEEEDEQLFDEKDDPQSLTTFFEKHNLSKKNRQFFRELHYSLEECYAIERGEIEPEQTYEDYLTELKQIAELLKTKPFWSLSMTNPIMIMSQTTYSKSF